MLLLAANLILVVTCSNITSLFFAHTSDRKFEVAIRSAIGAPRRAIAKQFFIESILVSIAAFCIAGILSLLICGFVRQSVELNAIFPRIDQLDLDFNVVAYAGLITILATGAFGLWPSVKGSRSDLGETLKSEVSSIGGVAGNRTQSFLIVCEVAITLAVLVGTLTLLLNLWKLRTTDPGFRSDRALAVEVSLPSGRYPTGAEISAFCAQLLPRLGSLRGIEVASATTCCLSTGHWL